MKLRAWEPITFKKTGKTKWVRRDEKGRFRKWRETPPKPRKPRKKPPVPPPKPPKPEKPQKGYYYDARLRVFYIASSKHKSRAGAIAIKIKSKEPLTQEDIYRIAVDEAKSRTDNWIAYVEPNKHRFLHVFEQPYYGEISPLETYEVEDFDFEDLKGW